MKPPYAIGSVPSLSGHAIAYRWHSLPRVCRDRASKPQGSSERVLSWQITMDQLIFASLSHTHYWYEVGMLKVPAVPRKESKAVPEGNGPTPQDAYEMITWQKLRRVVSKTWGEAFREYKEDLKRMDQRLASLEQNDRQPRLAMAADVPADKTRDAWTAPL